MVHWIEDHYIDEIKLDHMAKDIHLSKSYASRIFQQETGSSITDQVTALRLKQADIFSWKRQLCPFKRWAGGIPQWILFHSIILQIYGNHSAKVSAAF